MKTANLVELDEEDILFVVDALAFLSGYSGCDKRVQRRAASLAKVFRKLAGKKRSRS